jgi:hypothetical protein
VEQTRPRPANKRISTTIWLDILPRPREPANATISTKEAL